MARGDSAEIAELKQQLEALQKDLSQAEDSQLRLDSIVSASSDLFFVISKDGIHLDYRARDRALLFTSPETFLGKSIGEVLPKEAATPIYQGLEKCFAEQCTVSVNYALTLEKKRRHFEARMHPIDATRASIIVRDTSSRVEVENALRASDLRFRQIANTVDEIFWIGDPTTSQALYISPAWERIYGSPAAEIYADMSNWFKYIHPSDLAKVQAAVERSADTGLIDVEHRIVRPDKGVRWIRTRGFPIFDEDGKLFRSSGIAQDITAVKAVEEELRLSKLRLEERVRARTQDLARINHELKGEIESRKQSEAQFRTVNDTVPAIVAVHRGGRYLYVNQATCNITGYSMEELLSMDFWSLASPEHQQILKDRAGARMHGDSPPDRYEIQIYTKTGQPRWLLLSIAMIEFEGQPAVLGTGYDITDRRQVELELKRAKEAADAANLAKSEFLANMSHEIRTPISAILGFAEMLKACSADNAEYADYSNGILRNGQHLLELVNDVLDLSKIEAGEFRVNRSAFSVDEEIAAVLDMFHARIEEKRLQMRVTYDGPIPKLIRSDPTRFRQILINLIGNAIKFTLEGAIHLKVKLEATQKNRLLELRVEDTGVGISPSQQPSLFEPFSQGEHSFSRRFGGTGLGLTLARKHARALGGDVRLIKSQAGVGSTFCVTIDPGPPVDTENLTSFSYPLRVPLPKGNGSKNQLLKNCHILLVEDGIDNQVLFTHFLEAAGANVDIAADGREALRLADESHDLVLMDIQLPILDGYEATRLLRKNHYSKPIVALTAHAMNEERQRCLEAGCDDCLTKPIEAARLISEVKKWATSGRNGAVAH